jgi:hypothetical protein
VFEILLGVEPKINPNRILAIVKIGNDIDAVERPIFGLHLIAHIRSEHLQFRVCVPRFVASEAAGKAIR